jgi:hypothetical protein
VLYGREWESRSVCVCGKVAGCAGREQSGDGMVATPGWGATHLDSLPRLLLIQLLQLRNLQPQGGGWYQQNYPLTCLSTAPPMGG